MKVKKIKKEETAKHIFEKVAPFNTHTSSLREANC